MCYESTQYFTRAYSLNDTAFKLTKYVECTKELNKNLDDLVDEKYNINFYLFFFNSRDVIYTQVWVDLLFIVENIKIGVVHIHINDVIHACML